MPTDSPMDAFNILMKSFGSLIDASLDDAADRAIDRVLADIRQGMIGPKRSRCGGLAVVRFEGEGGAVIPAAHTAFSQDHAWIIRRFGPALPLSASLESGPVVASGTEGGGMCVQLAVFSPLPRPVFPGLLLPLPGPVGRCVRRVRALSADGPAVTLGWQVARSCLVVRPATLTSVPHLESASGHRIVVQIEFASGPDASDLPHIGTPALNVSLARVELSPAADADSARPLQAGDSLHVGGKAGSASRALLVCTLAEPAEPESEESWQRRGALAMRSRGIAWFADDYRELVAGAFPDIRLLDIDACIVGERDAVRLAVAPRDPCPTLRDALDLACERAADIERLFRRGPIRAAAVVVAEPPNVRVQRSPAPDDSLWPHRGLLIAEAQWSGADDRIGHHQILSMARNGVHYPLADWRGQRLETVLANGEASHG